MDEEKEPYFEHLQLHLNAELKAEVPKEAKREIEENHVVSRNDDVTGCGKTGFLYNNKTDSEALESVYCYARKIKSFLGWEGNAKDDFQLINETRGDPDNNSYILKRPGGNGENYRKDNLRETLQKKNNIDILFDWEQNNPQIDEFSSDNSKEIYTRNSILPGVEDYSSLTKTKTIENEKNVDEKQKFVNFTNNIPENSFHSEIFRSEIYIFIESDKRNSIVPLSRKESKENKDTFLNSFEFKSKKMEECLVQNDDSEEVGLNLNNVDSILKNESEELCSANSIIKSVLNSQESHQEFQPSHTAISSIKELNETVGKDETLDSTEKEDTNINISNEDSALEENDIKPSTNYLRKLSIGVVKEVIESAQNSIEDILNKKYSEIEDLTCQKDGIKQEESLREVDTKKYAEILDNEKIVENTSKEPEVNICNSNMSNLDNSIKAHIQYKNEKNKESKTKIANGEKQVNDKIVNIVLDDDVTCGLGRFKPSWMQGWATMRVYVILYSIIGILHGSYYSYLIGTLSTLEKRFAFKSKISGAIMIADEFTPLFLGVVIGYYAGRAHRPRLVAFGMLLSAGCCFATALPYFVYGPVQHFSLLKVKNQTGPEFCDGVMRKEACSEDERPPTLPAVLFLVLGSFMKGFGNLAYYAIGMAYMDDNSEKKNTPLYLAIALALRLLGPLVGFLMSSGFLKFYENPLEDPGFGPEDPRWIGAWWIGFCVQGVLLVIFTLPIALFPKRLPSHSKPEQKVTSRTKESMKDMFKGLLAALKRLAKNPIFIFMIINTVMTIFGHFGHAIMLPKYMENQFRLSASDASLLSGATSIACVMVSTVLGGLLIWKYKPSAKLLLSGMITSEIIMCLGYLALMIPRCEPHDMLSYGRNDEGLILNSVCNLNCDCSTTSFTPFCGVDGKTTLFSPCYAGCTQSLQSVTTGKEHKVFGNCSCVADRIGNMGGKITEGFCVDENCWTQTIVYICILLFLQTISNILTVAHTMILLRSVHPNDKSVALGTFETFICLFGFIPFPVTFGALVDSACLIWEKSCGETGNCWFYDTQKYNYLLHGVSCFFCGMCIICLTSLYCLSSRVRSLYTDEEDERGDYTDIKLDTVSGSVTKL